MSVTVKWVTTFQLRQQVYLGWTDQDPPEYIPFEVVLGGDPLDPGSWTLIIDHDPEGSPNKLYSLSITREETSYRLAFSAGQGSEMAGVTYDGEVVVDPSSGVISGDLSYDHSTPDGGCGGIFGIAAVTQ